MQVRLREAQEFAGSYINMSSIHYATNGIEMLGLPTHSPLLGTTAEIDRPGSGTVATANITPSGDKNDFRVSALTAGEDYNDTNVIFFDGSASGDNATATFDGMNLRIDIDPGQTTTNAIIAAIISEGAFTASLIAEGDNNDGTGKVSDLGTMGTVDGGTMPGNNDFAGAEYIGNLLYSDQNAIQVSGYMDGAGDIDWYMFDVDMQKTQQESNLQWPTVFDIDYADGMSRPDLAIWVYDVAGTLIYASDDSNLDDDLPGPTAGADTDDLDRGSLGPFDPYLGTVLLPAGDHMRYYVAVTTQARVPTALDQSLIRLEPVSSLQRAAEDHIDDIDSNIAGTTNPLFDHEDLGLNVEDYDLNDVVLYVCVGGDLYTVDPFTGEMETDVTYTGLLPGSNTVQYGDIAMRSDGKLYSFVTSVAAGGDQDLLMNYRSFSTEDGSLLSDQVTGINTFNDVDGTATATDPGTIHFQAMAHGWENNNYVVYAVGNSDSNGNYTGNLLYKFNANGTAIQMPGVDTEGRLPTDIIPLASLTTGPSLLASAATSRTSLDNDILNGMFFTITTPPTEEPDPEGEEGDMITVDGVTLTFEFELGVDVRLDEDGAAAVRDGDIFVIDDKTFEFNSGAVLEVLSPSDILDGTTFDLRNSNGDLLIFEIDNNGSGVGLNHVPIYMENVTEIDNAAQIIITAINNATYDDLPFGVTAGTTEAYPGRISLVGEESVSSTSTAGFVVHDDLDSGGDVIIDFEENMTPKGDTEEVFLTSITDAINTAIAGANAVAMARPDGFEGESGRITIENATGPNFAGTPALTEQASTPAGGDVIINLNAASTTNEVAEAIGAAINDAVFGVDIEPAATVEGSFVKITGLINPETKVEDPAYIDATSAGPVINAGSEGAGGDITGLAFLSGALYAVDSNGGFYEVMNYSSWDFEPVEPDEGPLAIEPTGSGASLRFISKIDDASFSGLSLGPQNVEDGVYSQFFFASTGDGQIFALNSDGELQPVFFNGQTSIAMNGVSGTTGLAFSTLDYNLWHVTESRSSDAGHGIEISPDNTRTSPSYHAPQSNDHSYWFGLEAAGTDQFYIEDGILDPVAPHTTAKIDGSGGQDAGTYNLPGGAHGTLTTNEFSLAGCEADDVPMLYFNYFLETDGNVNYVTDSARVYISHNGADWTMLASNILTDNGSFPEWNKYDDLQDYSVFNLKDGTGEWRQAQIDLSKYVQGVIDSLGSNEAGLNEALSGLRVKFEFATAGSMNIGEMNPDSMKLFEGGYLRAGGRRSIRRRPYVHRGRFGVDSGNDIRVRHGLFAGRSQFGRTENQRRRHTHGRRRCFRIHQRPRLRHCQLPHLHQRRRFVLGRGEFDLTAADGGTGRCGFSSSIPPSNPTSRTIGFT